ncbi:MAG: toll/interleukin-1 receptor domain-containing protein [Acetobacteraceae bacterium]|nr:toll/interleukin-1 receptor domain-containing protein [Acetobacteraceae bacterium]
MRIRESLEEAGVNVWWDDNQNLPGTDWGEHLRETMGKTDVVIALMTPASVASAWVMSEIGAAIAARKHIIPIVLTSGGLPPGLPGPLREWNFVRVGKRGAGEVVAEIRKRLANLPVRESA